MSNEDVQPVRSESDGISRRTFIKGVIASGVAGLATQVSRQQTAYWLRLHQVAREVELDKRVHLDVDVRRARAPPATDSEPAANPSE